MTGYFVVQLILPCTQSVVTLEVKPWDDETDMKALEDSVRSIEMDGLVWGASKLVPIGYGIRKLQITLVVGSSFKLSESTCNNWSYGKLQRRG